MTAREFDKSLDTKFSQYRNTNKDKLIEPSKFGNIIGSTRLEDIPYKDQIIIKESSLKDLFTDNVPAAILESLKLFESQKITEYRFKAEFTVSYNPKFEPFNRMGQRKKGNFSWVVDLDEYILSNKNIFDKARKVYEYAISLGLNGYDLRKNIGDLRYVTIKNYNNQSMIIITSANDDSRFENVLNFAKEQGFNSVYWLKNNTKHDSFEGEVIKFIGNEYLQIPINLDNKTYTFNVGPFTFFQNNIYCFETLIEYINNTLTKLNTKDKTLYDLYCGVGLLGILFADKFKEVHGIEIVKESIDLANKNKVLNNISNISFECEDIKSLKLENTNINIVLVDPPRNGLEEEGVKNVLNLNPEYIIYISCNPVTLNTDLKTLQTKYKVLDLKSFDMFPLTYHLESLCIMQKI